MKKNGQDILQKLTYSVPLKKGERKNDDDFHF